MKSTKINEQVQSVMHSLLQTNPVFKRAIDDLSACADRVLLVGGAVRDLIVGLPINDIDIEVHGLTLEQLEAILAQHGVVDIVGKAFGVVRLHGLDVDWSVPRADAQGRKPTVTLDPYMSLEMAFRRRDLTINAMGIDVVTFELIDPFGGLHDIRTKVLRTPDPHFFVEDPLRFFRVMHFIGRFEYMPDATLNQLCAAMSLNDISLERIEDEFEKLFLKSRRPSLAIAWLAHIGRLHEILPEVAALRGVQQRKDWHPEGDVFNHTMQAIDAAARITYTTDTDTLIIRYAALCHDLGKAVVTVNVDGIWRSSGHAKAGIPIAKTLLKRITKKKSIIAAVTTLVEYHMHPGQLLASHAPLSSYKRLAAALDPLPLTFLVDLFRVDRQGRNPHSSAPFEQTDPEVLLFEQHLQKAHVLLHKEPAVLQGRDLLGIIAPGQQMGQLLQEAYRIQLEEGIQDKEVLKARVLANALKHML